jgi:hypothetical protein
MLPTAAALPWRGPLVYVEARTTMPGLGLCSAGKLNFVSALPRILEEQGSRFAGRGIHNSDVEWTGL